MNSLLLILCYYIKNPRPKLSSVVKICYWNLNALAVYFFVKISLTGAFVTSHNLDIICLLEPFSDFTVAHYDENVNINSYHC